MTENEEIPVVDNTPPRLSYKFFKEGAAAFMDLTGNYTSANPWSAEDVDKLASAELDDKGYKEAVDQCRFFYKRDPIGSSVVNKMIDIGITDLTYDHSDLTTNELTIMDFLVPKLKEYAESMALEYLITGLLVPEFRLERVPKKELDKIGIKRYSTLALPTSMWLRDPKTIKIKQVLDRPSYFVKVPDDLVTFIQNEGKYADGNEDRKLYQELLRLYPDFVAQVRAGNKEILIENDELIIRRRVLTDSPYPIPYLYSAIEPMKHKRNLRRMDYSIASRVISAIQLIKMGDADFPITEGDEDQFDALRDQMRWRNTGGRNVERIFQLFANHTVTIEWIFPDVEVILNDAKYKDVNKDIFYALGFPGILVTGESERTAASEAEYAMLSPMRTIEHFRGKILKILNEIVDEIFRTNEFRNDTALRFEPVNLFSFKVLVEALLKLYESGNISRTTIDKVFGYHLEDELKERQDEKKLMSKYGIDEFAPQPFSPQPGQNQNQTPTKEPQNTTKLDDSNQ